MTVRKTSRWARWLALPIAVSLVAAACGGDDDTTTTDDVTVTTVDPNDDTDPADDTDTDETVTDEPVDAGAADDAANGLTPMPDGVDLDATIEMAYSVPPTMLDPDRSTTAGNDTYMYMWFDRLTEIGPDLEVLPYLATEWAYGDDGTTFTLTLREDAMFHDGTPFDADAVVANLNRSLTLEGSVTAAALAGVESVEKLGDFEVQLNLPEARPANLPVLFAGNSGAMISPTFIEDGTADLAAELADIGSGPYRAIDYRPGQGVTYERAPNYWDPGRQLAAEFSIDQVDPAARINGVRTGAFDLGQSAASDAAEAISIGETGAFNYLPYTINTVYGALFNPGSDGDLGNQQVRQAIMHAMDREAINEGLFDGLCEARFQPFPEGNKYHFPAIEERYPHDPELARQLIEESGIDNPTFDIEVSPGSYEPFAQVMQAQLADVGITMNIVPAETAAAPANFITGASESVYLVVLAYADVASVYANWYGGPFGNMLNPEVPETEAIRETAAAANDASLSEEEQLAAWEQVFTDIQELAVFAAGCAAPQVWMSAPSVIGVEDMPFIWAGAVVPYSIGKLAD